MKLLVLALSAILAATQDREEDPKGTLVYRMEPLENGAEVWTPPPGHLPEIVRDIVDQRLKGMGLGSTRTALGENGRLHVQLDPGESDRVAEVQRALARRGWVELAIVASEDDGLDMELERERLSAYLEQHPETTERGWPELRQKFSENLLPTSEEPPELPRVARPSDLPNALIVRFAAGEKGKRFEWHPYIPGLTSKEPADRYELVVWEYPFLPSKRGSAPTYDQPQRWLMFEGASCASAGVGQDPTRGITVIFELVADQQLQFEEFTARHVTRRFAILVDGWIVSAPVLEGALPGAGQISGPRPLGFTSEEARALASLLTGRPLPVRLVLEEQR